VLPSGDVLVAGGHDANVVDYASAELYDPATNRWTLTGSLNTSRRYPVQVGLANGEVPSPGYRGERSRPCCLYICANFILYTTGMDVAVSDLRAHLSDWLERARQGAEVIITDRGLPVARLLGLDTTPAIERLTAEGVIARPRQPVRPVASGRARPRPRRPVADIVSEQRR